MTLIRKSRTDNPFTLQGTRTEWYGSTRIDTPYGPQAHSDKQVTFSEGHAWPRDRGTGRDIGGEFESLRVRSNLGFDPNQVYVFGGSWAREYRGTVFFKNPHHWPTLDGLTDDQLRAFAPRLSDGDLRGKGSTAISITAPTNPVVDGTVALAEFYREGLPKMGWSFLKDPSGYLRAPIKGASGDYLAYQFGWLPIISDIRATAKVVTQTEALLKQLERDSGKNVRRRYRFPTLVQSNPATVDNLAPWPTLNSGYWSGQRTTSIERLHREVWFSGCFTYYFEPSKMAEVERIAAQARLLLGIKLSPDVLWNLMPWSWLSDWFANAGHVANNMSLFANDGLTLRYGYTMEYARRERFERVDGIITPYGTAPSSLIGSWKVESKRRVKAWPFSLGLANTGLDARQWSILTALGISRAPGRF